MMDFPGPVTCDSKFTGEDVAELRSELIQSGLDSWQAAELIASFLAARGYGISTVTARDALTRIGTSHCSVDYMYQELEQLALVM
jgi:hypothetical protein